MRSHPPLLRATRWLLERAVHADIRESALADFEEEFLDRSARFGPRRARLWYHWQAIRSVPRFLVDRLWWTLVMGRAYLTVVFRDIRKYPLYAAINLFGLSAGLACGLMALLFVQNELSYDRYHDNADRIYRVIRKRVRDGREEYSTITPWAMKELISKNFPEILNSTRVEIHRDFIVEYGDKRYFSDIVYADPSLLDIFTFPLARGDPSTVMREPDNVVLSEDMAQKMFGQGDPVGEMISSYYEDKKHTFRITGVLKNVPFNSHFRIDVLVPIEHLARRFVKQPNRLNSCATYLLLDRRADLAALEKKAGELIRKLLRPPALTASYSLQPLTAIYLHSENILSGNAGSRPAASYAISAVAALILLIACFNFMNLAIVRASRRSREIGQRSALGATRLLLFIQFLGETFLLAILAWIAALLLAPLLLPAFNSMIHRTIPLEAALNPRFLGGALVLALVISLLSGLYPATVLSSFRPVEILKGGVRRGTGIGFAFRRILVVFQCFLSIVFSISVVIVSRQIDFVQKEDLGFRKDNILGISIMRDTGLPKSPEVLKSALARHPGIRDIAVSFQPAGFDPGIRTLCQPEGFSVEDQVELNVKHIGSDFFRFFRIPILQGRDFSSDGLVDSRTSAIVNESAVRFLGWTEPIGKTVRSDWIEKAYQRPGPLTVIGVVRDYHDGPLHERIRPTLYLFDPERRFWIFLDVIPDDLPGTLAFIEKTLRDLNTIQPFEYVFMDDYLVRSFYQSDRSIRRTFGFSAILALILGGLGVFGLISFLVEQKRKEIGIRRVMGSSAPRIIRMFFGEYVAIVFLGGLLAVPGALWVGHLYLRDYAYRVSIPLWPFLAAPVGVLLITLATVGSKAAAAAAVNPAETLRHE